MTPERRAGLDRDAGGDDPEESAVCYLQILLADALAGVGRERMMQDMDAWGYSFRLGSTRAWFEGDAEDARAWLARHGVIDAAGRTSPAASRGRMHRQGARQASAAARAGCPERRFCESMTRPRGPSVRHD